MRARRLLDGAAFGPEATKAVCQAFDAAWEQIKGNFGDNPSVVDEARYRLANAVLSVAAEESRNVEALTRGALESMARPIATRLRSALHSAGEPAAYSKPGPAALALSLTSRWCLGVEKE